MSKKEKTLTPRLVKRLWLAFTLVILLMGASYILITGYFANKYNQATIQPTMSFKKSFRTPRHFWQMEV